jgi:hypothetical protein
MNMRTFVLALVLVLAGAFAIASAQADKLTEENMTKSDYDAIATVDATGKNAGTVTVHNIKDPKAVEAGHGVKVIKGKEWKRLSPKERGDRLAAFKANTAQTVIFIVEVPSGNVWAIKSSDALLLEERGDLKPWKDDQTAKLPKAVKADSSNGQENRRNSGAQVGFRFTF